MIVSVIVIILKGLHGLWSLKLFDFNLSYSSLTIASELVFLCVGLTPVMLHARKMHINTGFFYRCTF